MFGSGRTPQITGHWQYSDNSTHKVGLAPTDLTIEGQPVLALGNEEIDNPAFVTRRQIEALSAGVQEGKFDNLLAK